MINLSGHWQVAGTTAGLFNLYLNIAPMWPQEWSAARNLNTWQILAFALPTAPVTENAAWPHVLGLVFPFGNALQGRKL